MKWVKIEDGCEMPDYGEVVLAVEEDGGDRNWFECEYWDGKFKWTGIGDAEIRATHWARVELPEE